MRIINRVLTTAERHSQWWIERTIIWKRLLHFKRSRDINTQHPSAKRFFYEVKLEHFLRPTNIHLSLFTLYVCTYTCTPLVNVVYLTNHRPCWCLRVVIFMFFAYSLRTENRTLVRFFKHIAKDSLVAFFRL